jgi:hypothetical protein
MFEEEFALIHGAKIRRNGEWGREDGEGRKEFTQSIAAYLS